MAHSIWTLSEYCKAALFNSLFCTNICSNNFDNVVATSVRGRINSLSIFRNIKTKEKIHNESTNPLMDVQIGHIGRRNRVTKVEIHQMRMKLDVGNSLAGLRRFLLLTNDPIWTFERKCQLASFGQSKCRVSGAGERICSLLKGNQSISQL